MCIDFRKLNTATRKDHFSLPFVITNVFSHGAVEIHSPSTGKSFKVMEELSINIPNYSS